MLLVRQLLIAILFSLASYSAQAQTERVPAEPMSYLGADWLERAGRVTEERPDLVLDRLALEPGMKVADLGAGSGYYARRIAERVMPRGVVYGIDIQPEMLEILERLAAEEGVEGIVPVLSTEDDPRLPQPVDLVLMADVYHEIADPLPVQRALHRSLTPGGRVVLLEYRVEDGTGDSIKSDHRMSVRQVVAEWEAAGFRLLDLYTALPTQHMIVLGRIDDPVAAPSTVHADLAEALAAGTVEASARADRDGFVELTVEAGGDELVVTAPAGTRFVADDGRTELLARRDVLVVVPAGGKGVASVRTIPRRWDLRPPGENAPLRVSPVATDSPEARLLRAVQGGMYGTAGQPRAYAPQTSEVESAAIWLALEEAAWPEVRQHLDQPRFPAAYAAAFGLALAAEAGFDPTILPAWRLRGEIFSRLQVEDLMSWYRSRQGG